MNFWKKEEKKIVFQGNKLNVVESCVDRHAENFKTRNKLALVLDDGKKLKKYSYAELNGEVNKVCNFIKTLKLKPNSRLALFLPKCPEMYINFLAIIKSGYIAVPLFEAFQKGGLELRLDRGEISLTFTNKGLSKRLNKKYKRILVDNSEYKNKIKKQSCEFEAVLKNKFDTSMMIFTSSTAGTPVAGVEIPHYGIVQQHFTAEYSLDLNENDNYWCTAHPGWVTGSVYGILAPFSIGCTNYVYCPHFDSKKFLKFITKNKISVMYTAPTALRLLKNDAKKIHFKNLRHVCSVGEALPPNLFRHFKKLGVEICDTYWQTETGAIVVSNTRKGKKKAGSIGKAIPGIKCKIKNKMLYIKTPWPSMMHGIYKHPQMYKDYFEGKWFKTNDLIRKDFQNYFFFEARKDDIIKTSGERVSPLEIEDILIKHPAVKECAVIGVPDKIKGSVIKAFVTLNKNSNPSDQLAEKLKKFVKENYAGHSYPKIIEFRESLPKTNSGKIIRMRLREENSSKS